MNIKFKVFLIYFALVIMTSCTISTCNHALKKDVINYPTTGFAKIHKVFSITKCHDSQGCMPGTFANVGSGAFVANSDTHSYVLTAGHVCITEVTKEMMQTVAEFSVKLYVQNYTGKLYTAEVIHEDYRRDKDANDLCLLRLRKVNHINVKLGAEDPVVGERVYAMSSPVGLYHPPAVPLLEGRYSGKIAEYNKAGLVTIPAVGGSSGSAVLNADMQIVGLIYAAAQGFENASIMVNLSEIIKFLDEGLIGQLEDHRKIFHPYPWINHPTTF